MGVVMDWKLDKQKRDRNIAFGRLESAQKISMLEEFDKKFEKIFGKNCEADLSPGGSKAGDPVRRSELSNWDKSWKGD
jgi:hypothetical protein